jgi:hypothetical protein
MYIGSAEQGFEYRYEIHLEDLKKNWHYNAHLKNFANKYGLDKLKFEILEIVEDKEKVLEREQYWIDKYWDSGLLFNTARDAKAPMAGRKHTEEAKKKMKGRIISEERKKKMSLENKGLKHTEETKEKMRGNKNALGSKSTLGRKHSVETKQKMSLAQKGNKHGLGNKNTLGLKHTEETKEKIRKSRIAFLAKRKLRSEP